MATKYLAKTFSYGVIKQTNWATPTGVTGAFKTVAYNAGSVIFDPDVRVELFNTSGQNSFHKEWERVFIDARSGLPTVSFSMPGDVKTIAPHLVGALFGVIEAAGSPFTKNLTAAGLTDILDFNGNDAPLHTIAMDDKASADDGIILENAIIGNLNLSWDLNLKGQGRLLQMSGNWVGNEMNFEQTMTSGNWTTTTFKPMGNTDLYSMQVFSIDGDNVVSENIRRFTFNIANNVTTNSSTTGGKANNYDISPVYTSTIILDYNATTEKVLKDYQDGARVIVTFDSDITGGNDGHFEIASTRGIIQKQPSIYNGDFMGIELNVMWHSISAGAPVTMTLTDTVDWTY